MTDDYMRILSLVLLAFAISCSDDSSFRESVDSVAVANPELGAVSNENALGVLYRAVMQSMERAELLQERAQDTRLRDLAVSLREERAAPLLAVSDEARLAGVQLDPPADSVSSRTPGRALRQAHQDAMRALREADSTAFDSTFASVASAASLQAADVIRSFDAAALSPGVLEQVRSVAAALTWEADEIRGAVADSVDAGTR